jgi:hypothetical protein
MCIWVAIIAPDDTPETVIRVVSMLCTGTLGTGASSDPHPAINAASTSITQ